MDKGCLDYWPLNRCTAIVSLTKPFIWWRSRCRRRRGLLKLPIVETREKLVLSSAILVSPKSNRLKQMKFFFLLMVWTHYLVLWYHWKNWGKSRSKFQYCELPLTGVWCNSHEVCIHNVKDNWPFRNSAGNWSEFQILTNRLTDTTTWKIMLRLVIWSSMMLLGWTETKLWTLKYCFKIHTNVSQMFLWFPWYSFKWANRVIFISASFN